MISLRPMTEDDLPQVEAWLRLPHVARWWTPESTAEQQIAEYRQRVTARYRARTTMLIATWDGDPIGWCQWYLWADYPAEAEAMGARDAGAGAEAGAEAGTEAGIDYAVGDPDLIGLGIGTQLVAALVTEVRRSRPGAGIMADPDARNIASRRVLEKNGFELVAVRPVATEPSDRPMAIYRLSAIAEVSD